MPGATGLARADQSDQRRQYVRIGRSPDLASSAQYLQQLQQQNQERQQLALSNG